MDDDDALQQADICRVCRSEGCSERPLFYPCICTGSIKYIHQECLVQWMRYSRKEYCELCGHRFSFTPIYSPDMPRRLPLRDVAAGLLSSIATAVRHWCHYTMVAGAWLGIVPLTACRIYRCLFTGSVHSVLTLPLDLLSMDNLAADILHGCLVVTCTLFAFLGLVWLREQILHGGGPDWLEQDQVGVAQPDPPPPAPAAPDPVPAAEEPEGANPVDPQQPERAQGLMPNAAQDLPLVQAVDQGVPQGPQRGQGTLGNEGLQVGEGIQGGGERQEGPNDAPRPWVQVAPAEPDVNVNNNQANQQEQAPEEEAQEEDLGDEGANGGGDENNWNPIEWNAAAEELTWERLLGLDGSLVFLEHVFWVVSLNTLFVLVFAFCPYHIGHFTVMGFKLGAYAAASHFEGLVTTLVGYCVIGLALVALHAIASVLGLNRPCRALGLCYVVVKVSLLCVVEIGVLPLVCGWWLDICSLAMFDASLRDRELSFRLAPGTSLFIHWLVGMVYVYYFASFVLLLREVLRPGVLWFLRNLNDPDFSPIQEMIHMSVTMHVRRLLLSAVIFGTAVLLMLWLPVHFLRAFCQGFLPYVVALSASPVATGPPHPALSPTLSSSATSVLTGGLQTSAVSAVPSHDPPTHGSELSLELLLLQVVLPALLEQSHTRSWLKGSVRCWCTAVAWLLDLRSYLLGQDEDMEDQEDQDQGQEQGQEDGDLGDEVDEDDEDDRGEPLQGLGAAHQVLLHRDREPPVGNQPYIRPRWFPARLCGLLLLLGISLMLTSLATLTVPVWLGRRVLSLAWSRQGETVVVHELYTAAAGTYLCWASARGIGLITAWAPRGRAAMGRSLRRKLGTAAKSAAAAVILLGLVPLLFGTLLEAVVVVPLRVPLHQTPVLCAWQDWALGVLYTKIACAVTLMGPNWWLKTALERAYRDGIRDLNLVQVLKELAVPVVTGFGLALAVPYILSQSVVPLVVSSPTLQVFIARRIYPFLLLAVLTLGAGAFQVRQFKRLYEHIKNDKYLVGRRLVNYDHQRRRAAAAARAQSSH